MSFILDALRKSEHERRRSAVPGISSVPQSAPPRSAPIWAIATISLLAFAVILLGSAWWRSARNTPSAAPTAVTQPQSRPLPAPIAQPPVARAAPAVTTAPAPVAVERPPAETPPTPASSRPLAAAVQGARESPLADTARAPASATESPVAVPQRVALSAVPAEPEGEPTLPSVAALLAEGVVVPPLRLELHAYSDRPAQRFVFINGNKYVEGQRLAEGPQLLSIAPNGAVLVQQGHRFLLSPE